MDTEQIPVPIELRSHERAQLEDFVPRLRERLEDAGRDDLLDTLDGFTLDAHDEGVFNTTEQWRTVIMELHRLKPEEGLRQWWLRRKLFKRLVDRVEALEGDD